MANGSTVFVDTNVLLYALDPRDAAKQGAALVWVERCWADRCGRISTQVLHELYANLRRVAPSYDRKAARTLVQSYRSWLPWAVDEATVELAWKLEDRVSVSYWDALMVASAQQHDCSWLLTEDLQHDRDIDGVRIINPFMAGPDVLDSAA